MTTKTPPAIIEVPPSRLSAGEWSHELNRQIGEGDIYASYSADRIGMGSAIRRPFVHGGSRWVCVGMDLGREATAYRLVHPSDFGGTPMAYGVKVAKGQGDDARRDPMGFYHGMAVRAGGEELVLCGPPVRFVPGEEPQGSLFD